MRRMETDGVGDECRNIDFNKNDRPVAFRYLANEHMVKKKKKDIWSNSLQALNMHSLGTFFFFFKKNLFKRETKI